MQRLSESNNNSDFTQPNYTIIKQVGTGSYGQVFKAKSLDKVVAIKKVENVFANTTKAYRFLREIKLLRLFKDHPNIVSLNHINLPVDTNNFNEVELIFDFFPADLQQIISSNQNLTELQIQYIVYQMLCGINYMHSTGVLHRDLKPANILIQNDCKIKICDLGLSRAINVIPELEKATQSYLTQASANQTVYPTDFRFFRRRSMHVVTRWYRAPEVILQANYGPAVDMWSIGCILGELLQMQENIRCTWNRRPLFPGINCFPMSADKPEDFFDVNGQYNTILNVLGTPSDEKLSFLNKDIRNIVKIFPPRKGVVWEDIFPGINPQALDLLARLLAFDPNDRITAAQALHHPYLQKVFNDNANMKPNLNLEKNDYSYLVKYYAFEKELEEEKHSEQSKETELKFVRQLVVDEISQYQKPMKVMKGIDNNVVQSENKTDSSNNNNSNNNLLSHSIFSWAQIVKKGIGNTASNIMGYNK